MQSKATTVEQYLAELPEDRRAAIEAIRKVILANLDPTYQEGMQYGMIGYFVPHRVYPAGYHCDPKQPLPFASVASQKNHMAIYLFCDDTDAAESKWFREAWLATGRKLDMGKSCVRFKTIEDVALDVLGEAIRRRPALTFIEFYEKSIAATRAQRDATKAAKPKAAEPKAKKPVGKQSPVRKVAVKAEGKAKKVAVKAKKRG